MLAKRKAKSKEVIIIGKAEVKITIALTYYILVGVMTLISLTLSQLRTTRFDLNTQQDISAYIICAISEDCSRFDGAEIITTVRSLSDVAIVMLACLPIFILVLTADFLTCAKKLRLDRSVKWLKRRFAAQQITEDNRSSVR